MDDLKIPAGFIRLSVPMPPMLPEVIGLKSEQRFFSLSYEYSKPFWSDGRAVSAFSYYSAYEPYVNHLSIAIYLFDVNLGSDDASPTHALLIDRQTRTVHVGDYNEVGDFLQEQHPTRRYPTPEEIEEMYKELARLQEIGLDEYRECGMFTLGSTPAQQSLRAEMIEWLDQLITEDLMASCLTAANAGDMRMLYHLRRFLQRIEQGREINTSSRWTN